MGELSALADSMDGTFGPVISVVSGGDSGNLDWALGDNDRGRINELRLGEAILLGRETLHRRPIEGLHTDAITLPAEVIESKIKPSQAWGEIAQAACGEPEASTDRGLVLQTLLAVGRQDTDPDGLEAPAGMEIPGSSSDHLVLDCGGRSAPVGSEIAFGLDYGALVRAMTSPFVAKVTLGRIDGIPTLAGRAQG